MDPRVKEKYAVFYIFCAIKAKTQARRMKMWIVLIVLILHQLIMRYFGLIYSGNFDVVHWMANCRKYRQNHGVQPSCMSISIGTKKSFGTIWIKVNTKRTSINGCHTKIYWTEFPSENRCWIVAESQQRKAKTVLTESRLVGRNGGKTKMGIFWDWQGIICCELISYGETLNLELYGQ